MKSRPAAWSKTRSVLTFALLPRFGREAESCEGNIYWQVSCYHTTLFAYKLKGCVTLGYLHSRHPGYTTRRWSQQS